MPAWHVCCGPTASLACARWVQRAARATLLCSTRDLLLALCLCLQGEYCLQIKMDILPGSGIASVGAQSVRVPATAQSIVRQVSQGCGWCRQGHRRGCRGGAATVNGMWPGGALGDASGLCGDCSAKCQQAGRAERQRGQQRAQQRLGDATKIDKPAAGGSLGAVGAVSSCLCAGVLLEAGQPPHSQRDLPQLQHLFCCRPVWHHPQANLCEVGTPHKKL